MSNDIKQLVSCCVECTKVLPSQPSNPMTTPSPSTHFGFPMQHVGLDLFSFGNKEFLICVDHWSGYPFYCHLRSLSTSVISTLTSWFNLFGWPMSIRSDGGPQFRGEFTRFCEVNNIRHELSAPYNPKSNGLAEAGVKSVKNILRKSMSSGEDADRMLYEWRNVPRSDGFSPAQLLFGRAQRTSLPTLPSQITPIAHLCLLFLHKSHLLTSILLLHQKMLHMHGPSLTMTGRSIHCLCCLLARMS